jgi:signal peptidase II
MQATPHTKAVSRPQISYFAIAIGIFVLLMDQLSKWYVSHYVDYIDSHIYWYPYGGIPVFENFGGIQFSINYMTNKGAAWGAFGDYQVPLIALRIGLIAGLLVYLFYNRHRSWQIPLILIVAGALGNVLDFFIYGHVVDMFHFVLWHYDFPIFNVADSSITLGIFSLFFLSWSKAEKE